MDEKYMELALSLAMRANGRTSPNPMVGAVLVRNGEIVGEGWHMRAGTPHAEIHALQAAGELAYGSTLYVTLEPCSHHGRTGPCTEAIIKAGVKKVVIAMVDPNPLVAGNGINKLRRVGVEVVEGVLAKTAARLNEVFLKWITTRMPFTVLKTAMTLDGKIATSSGHSRWITGENARQQVHKLRDQYDAILVGIGTVLADNPALTTRLPSECHHPVRIVVDSLARTPLDSQLVNDGLARTIIAVTKEAPSGRIEALAAKGVEVLVVPEDNAGVDLRHLFQLLGSQEITSILVEGGAMVNASILKAGLADKVCWFIAPKIVGGHAAPGPIGGQGATFLHDAWQVKDMTAEFAGQDLMISGYLRDQEEYHVHRTC